MVNVPIEYSDKPVTPFGGMALMKRFVDQTGIREHLVTLDLPWGGSNCAYDPVHVIEAFWLGIWTGGSRYIHCDWLGQDETLAAKAYANLKNEVYGMKDWVEVCPGIAVKEWRHQPADPKAKARRHIVVRKETSRRPLAGGKLLFEDQPVYRFSLYVTNLDLPLDQIWKIYNTRADCEPSAAR